INTNRLYRSVVALVVVVAASAVVVAAASARPAPETAPGDLLDPRTYAPDSRLYLVLHATGVQKYTCQANGTWLFTDPEATLYKTTGASKPAACAAAATSAGNGSVRASLGVDRPRQPYRLVLAGPDRVSLVRFAGLLRSGCAVLRRDRAHRVANRIVGTRPDHQNRARPIPGTDDHMGGVGRAVEVVPLPQRALLFFDDQSAFARQHEKPLLRALRVVEGVRLTRPEDADADADVAERMLA